ncbi:MAG TPA: two-component system response regulator NarL [Zoogloea sp.]|uniref:two-component system response regulator NarL n=1 Tax=Zoogloea sp. TaxID=49181 RepID=UPI002CBC30DB|nr:two-component system response regulator NarL [Zoogloea sp.]HMV16703.1 two-component system response regulator NarL [Rhodocyclaceae bacterium]HMV61859.1 two-component system response regulator NarL [Rhodocyclaceae bacterium]HMW52135.1 two-component system response regulator NarL [Rhodocyclaceae bacterium]HMY48117.1 two-component system response regulator NarL [Rhodocyclaceae bacterium]HMZ74676.1 two-component system response regulator NarL [Rhodocyclaceae bacterium]
MTATEAPSTVIVIDDHPLFRKGVCQLIALSDRLRLVGEASSGEDGLTLAQTADPDLILLDLNMKGMSGIDTLRALRDADLGARIIILTVSDAAEDLVAAIRAGADGYLLKDTEPEDLLARMSEALAGRIVIDDSLTGLLARSLREEAQSAERSLAHLTERERAILQCLATGLSNKLIGRELGIAEGTVKVHIKSLLRKLKFRSRLEAAVWAIEQDTR